MSNCQGFPDGKFSLSEWAWFGWSLKKTLMCCAYSAGSAGQCMCHCSTPQASMPIERQGSLT